MNVHNLTKNMQHVIGLGSEVTFEKAGVVGRIFETKALIEVVEFVVIETSTGHETTIIEHECDFCYYILEGEGYFVIDGEKEVCVVGNLVVIPKGTAFTYKGELKMLLVVSPPFYPEQEEVL